MRVKADFYTRKVTLVSQKIDPEETAIFELASSGLTFGSAFVYSSGYKKDYGFIRRYDVFPSSRESRFRLEDYVTGIHSYRVTGYSPGLELGVRVGRPEVRIISLERESPEQIPEMNLNSVDEKKWIQSNTLAEYSPESLQVLELLVKSAILSVKDVRKIVGKDRLMQFIADMARGDLLRVEGARIVRTYEGLKVAKLLGFLPSLPST